MGTKSIGNKRSIRKLNKAIAQRNAALLTYFRLQRARREAFLKALKKMKRGR